MTFTLTINDAVATRVIDGLAYHYNYQDMILDTDGTTLIPNPVTKAAFAKQVIIKSIKMMVMQREKDAWDKSIEIESLDIT